ncbi:MAG: sugar phosphate isomerase/epimerase [Ferruginibacter sp.]|nr:sugar phosphate isomerase/epimerase [Cytophagales bacterium]
MNTKTTRRDFLATSVLAAGGLSAGWNAFGLHSVREPVPGAGPEKRVATSRAGDGAAGRVCVFSKHLHWLDYPGLAAAAAEVGFDGIDLTVRPGGHVLPERVATDLPKAVAAVRKAGLQVYMLTTAITDADQPHTEAILKTAGGLGIGYYRTGWLSYQADQSIPQNLETFRVRLGKLAELNQRHAIHGAYQNHAGTGMGAALWDLWTVLKDLDPRWMGCQYDARHATVEGGNSWPLGLNLLQSHIRTTDIKDFVWAKKDGKWQEEDVPLGTGMVDFRKYFGLIKQYGIQGPVSLHYEYPLGGAEHGDREVTMKRDEIIRIMKNDLTTLRTWLREAGLE